MKVINFDMIMYHGKPTKYYFHFEKKILSMINALGISPSPRGNCAYGCRLFWAVDMSTPLLLEVRGRGRGVALKGLSTFMNFWGRNADRLAAHRRCSACNASSVGNVAAMQGGSHELNKAQTVTAFLSANTSRELVTSTFDLMTLNSWYTWRVAYPTLKSS